MCEGQNYNLRSKTLHSAGLNSAFDESVRVLWRNATEQSNAILHPCLQSGYRKSFNVTGLQPDEPDATDEILLIGSIDLEGCQNLVEKVGWLSNEYCVLFAFMFDIPHVD